MLSPPTKQVKWKTACMRVQVRIKSSRFCTHAQGHHNSEFRCQAIRVSELVNYLIRPGPPGPIKTGYTMRRFSNANGQCPEIQEGNGQRDLEGCWKEGWAST